MDEAAQNIGRVIAITECPRCGHPTGIPAARSEEAAEMEAGETPPARCEYCGGLLQAPPGTGLAMEYASAPRTLWQRLRNHQPWGFWSTTGIAFSTLVIQLIVGVAILVALIAVMAFRQDRKQILEAIGNLEYNGMFLAVTTIIVSLFTCAWLHLTARLRGIPWRQYFAFHRPSAKTLALWVIILLAWLVLEEAYTTYYLDDSDKTAFFMNNIYNSAGFLPLFLLGVVVAAPISEEWLFRGFMFAGYARSPVGVVGAIGIPAFFWALMHIQYDFGFIGVIFAMGLLFGAARQLTGTIVVPIVMHMACNLLATLQVAYDFHLFPVH